MQADRVRAIRGAGAEDAPFGICGIVAWMDPQDVATRTIEPGEHEHLVAGANVAKTSGDRLLELWVAGLRR